MLGMLLGFSALLLLQHETTAPDSFPPLARSLRRLVPAMRGPPRLDLVVCLADGVEYNGAAGARWIVRFAGTFRRYNAAARLVFFTRGVHPSVEAHLQEFDVIPQNFSDQEPPPWDKVEVASRRWRYIRQYLDDHPEHASGWVLAVDARDLFFQADPFQEPRLPTKDLIIAMEGQADSWKSHEWNAALMALCYNETEYDAIPDGPVSCSGTTMGSFHAMRTYTLAMEREILARSANETCLTAGGRDQAHHNKLFYAGDLERAGLRVLASRNADSTLFRTLGDGVIYRDVVSGLGAAGRGKKNKKKGCGRGAAGGGVCVCVFESGPRPSRQVVVCAL